LGRWWSAAAYEGSSRPRVTQFDHLAGCCMPMAPLKLALRRTMASSPARASFLSSSSMALWLSACLGIPLVQPRRGRDKDELRPGFGRPRRLRRPRRQRQTVGLFSVIRLRRDDDGAAPRRKRDSSAFVHPKEVARRYLRSETASTQRGLDMFGARCCLLLAACYLVHAAAGCWPLGGNSAPTGTRA
jgi:hypothetical protein